MGKTKTAAGRVLRFAVSGALLVGASGAVACGDDDATINEPYEEPTINEPAEPESVETPVDQPAPEPSPAPALVEGEAPAATE